MTNKKIRPHVGISLDSKNQLYWLFPYDTVEPGFSILSFPAKKFSVATTDCKTLIETALDMMQYCKLVNYKEADQKVTKRFKSETGWATPNSLHKASSASLSIVIYDTEIVISVYNTKGQGKSRGAFLSDIKCPRDASIDDLAKALEEAFERSENQ